MPLNMKIPLFFLLMVSLFALHASSSSSSSATHNVTCRDFFPFCPSQNRSLCKNKLIELYCRKSCEVACQTNAAACQHLNCTQRCVLSDNSSAATCACLDGFSLDEDGRTCNDINECAEDANLCSNMTMKPFCLNLVGEYACVSCLAYQQSRLNNYYERNECCLRNRETTCGKRALTTGRIIETPTGFALRRWPWAVNIEIGNRICGGALISQRYVLTTAHCLGRIPINLRNITIYAGILKYTDINRGVREQIFHPHQVFIHPDYTFPHNDIALLRLSRPAATPSSYVSTICLPGGEEPSVGLKCYASGYGDMDASRSWTRQDVSLDIAPPSLCTTTSEALERANATAQHLCAGNSAGENGTCQGDSGGPLVCQRCNNCDWYLAGITAIGRGCSQSGSYTTFTNIREHERWITSITGQEFTQESCVKQSWGQWSSWSECSSSCGNGTRSRTRSCLNGIAGVSGCFGEARQKSICHVQQCSDDE